MTESTADMDHSIPRCVSSITNLTATETSEQTPADSMIVFGVPSSTVSSPVMSTQGRGPVAPCGPPVKPRWSRFPRSDDLSCNKKAALGSVAKKCKLSFIPPLWTSTARVAPNFAGNVPYLAADCFALDKCDAPMLATTDDDDYVCFYVGLYRDLRDRVALIDATVIYESEVMMRHYHLYRGLVKETENRGKIVRHKLTQMAGQVDLKKEEIAERNKAKQRRSLQLP